MSTTIGQEIDKLITVDTKMYNNQEMLYKIRRMSEEEFISQYSDKMSELYLTLKKACDLNIQRQDLITFIDKIIVDLIEKKIRGEYTGDAVIEQHKTY